MNYVDIPLPNEGSVAFFLATEEYVARNRTEDDCFFMWQVEPSVIFGRNQLIENEVNLPFCKAHNIHTFRRKSGGGCVYADRSNIMFSYINTGNAVQFVFDRYIYMVAHLLDKLGLDAHPSNRNDIMIGDKKVSGNAFYHIPGRNIVHGTMLFDTNMENMVGSITPSDAKLVSKGVKSIRQHITLLKDHLQMDIETFKKYIKENLCDSTITLTENDVQKIKEIEKEYLLPEFIYGCNPSYTMTFKKRIEGSGDFEVSLRLKNNIIKDVNIMGDYFLCGDLDHGLLQKLHNIEYDTESIDKALEGVDVKDYILNLKNEDFTKLLISNKPQ